MELRFMIFSRTRRLGHRLLPLAVLFALAAGTVYAQSSYPRPEWSEAPFTPLAQSALSGYSSQIETYYRDLPPETSGWTIVDATDRNETNWSSRQRANCNSYATPHTVNRNDNDGAVVNCLWSNADANTVIYLPAGEYDWDSNGNMINYVGRDADKVLRGAGAGMVGNLAGATVINLTRTDGSVQRVAGNSDNHVFGAATSWTAGYAGGNQVLTVASTANISVPGWVYLTAGRESWSDDSPFYHVRVVCKDGTTGSDCSGVSRGQIKIDRGLPYSREWNNGAPRVQPWTPAVERIGFESFAIRFTDPLRLSPQPCGANAPESVAFYLGEMAEGWVDDVQFVNGWKRIMYFDKAARMSLRNSAFASQQFAKAFDHEMIQVLNTSDTLLEANYFRQAGEAVTHGAGIRGIFAYNVLDDPDENPFYDKPDNASCTGPGSPWGCCTGNGSGSCGAAYCDDDGDGGVAYNRIDTCTTSMFMHNQSSHSVLYERNTFQCPALVDHRNLPGGWVTWFGNRGEEDGGADNWSRDATISRAGSFFVQGSGLASGLYRENWVYLNNHINELGVGTAYNTQARGTVVSDNVIRGSCTIDETGGNWDSSNQCRSEPGRHVVGSHAWSNNDVGTLEKTARRTMPTSLYHTESTWTDFVSEQGGSGTPPWVGADMDTFTGSRRPYTSPTTCLPAKEKWVGSCR